MAHINICIFEGDVLLKPIVANAGLDISHWFNPKTKDVSSISSYHYLSSIMLDCAKTKAPLFPLHASTWKVQSLLLLNKKFQASSLLL